MRLEGPVHHSKPPPTQKNEMQVAEGKKQKMSSLARGKAAAAAAYLPQPIIMEILSRLPVKTLLRFCCVCRLWRDLILHDPHFIELHRLHHETKEEASLVLLSTDLPGGGVGEGKGENMNKLSMAAANISLSPFPERWDYYHRYDIIVSASCCHGLVLMYSCSCSSIIRGIRVHNISTREAVTLPAGTRAEHQVAGLCYDVVANVYKVVRMFALHDSAFRCEIFTLGVSNSWTAIATILPIHRLPTKAAEMSTIFTFSNNALHWKDMEPTATTTDNGRRLVIRAFDPSAEKTYLIPMPPSAPPHQTTLTRLKGFLSLVYDNRLSQLDIWMLVDYTNGNWVKAFSIPYRDFPPIPRRPIYVSGDGNFILFKGCGFHLLLYNARTKTQVANPLKVPTSSFMFTVCSQSLLPVGRRW